MMEFTKKNILSSDIVTEINDLVRVYTTEQRDAMKANGTWTEELEGCYMEFFAGFYKLGDNSVPETIDMFAPSVVIGDKYYTQVPIVKESREYVEEDARYSWNEVSSDYAKTLTHEDLLKCGRVLTATIITEDVSIQFLWLYASNSSCQVVGVLGLRVNIIGTDEPVYIGWTTFTHVESEAPGSAFSIDIDSAGSVVYPNDVSELEYGRLVYEAFLSDRKIVLHRITTRGSGQGTWYDYITVSSVYVSSDDLVYSAGTENEGRYMTLGGYDSYTSTKLSVQVVVPVTSIYYGIK